MASVIALAANPSTAHHDVTSAFNETDKVEHLMELTYSSCFGHGDDLDGLQTEAKLRGWKAARAQHLERNATAVSEMIGGWVFSDESGSFAILQSRFKESGSAYLCSITAKLPFDRHDQVKASFERRFATTLAQEAQRSGQHIDRFLITSPHSSSIQASIVYVPSRGLLTINMVHGRALAPGAP